MGRKRKAVDENEPVEEEAPAQGAGRGAGAHLVQGFGTAGLDPDVVELCDHYHIDQHYTKELHAVMLTRQETFENDMNRLWTDLDEARNPNGLLISLMKQMDAGTFVGQAKPDPEMLHLVKKFNLDKESNKRLTDCICRHPPEKRQMYYAELELHLDASNRPSAQAMMLLRKIKDGESLGSPKGGGKGGGGDKGKGKGKGKDEDDRRGNQDRGRDDRDRNQDRDRGRDRGYDDRDRDRGSDRDRDRGQDRDRDRRGSDRDDHRGGGGGGRDSRDDDRNRNRDDNDRR